MKNIFFLMIMAIAIQMVAQQDEGIIVYNQTVNVHKMMGEAAEQFKDMIPEFRTSKMELKFKGKETLYQRAEDQGPEEINAERGGMRIRMMGGGGARSEATYRNFDENISVASNEFLGKLFLINGEIPQQEWKMTGESKLINGMMCMKATTIDSVENRRMNFGRRHGGESSEDSEEDERSEETAERIARNITAWFTPSIPVPAGPENFGNLPGLILELDINDGDTHYLIDILELKKLEENIEKPTKGKEVTREEYQEIVREKMKEMRENGGGGVFIRRG